MSITTPDISIVIVSYNVREYLCHCIDSILAQRNILAEIIVVDNNSSDGTVEFVKTKYQELKMINNSFNAGFSTANNQGIKASSGEIVFLLNPDTELIEPGTLEVVKNYLEKNQETGILAPRLLNSDKTFQPSFWDYPGIFELLSELFYLHRMKSIKQSSSPVEVQAASGAALAFKKSLINEIGGLDESMFWMEDTDFCYRAAKAGKKIVWNPAIKVIHHGGKSSEGNENIAIPNQVLSRIKFSKKHDSKFSFFLVDIISLIFICSRLFAATLISIFNKKFRTKRSGYYIAFKSYFRYNFQNESSIIK